MENFVPMSIPERLSAIKKLAVSDKKSACLLAIETCKTATSIATSAEQSDMYHLTAGLLYESENFTDALQWYSMSLAAKRLLPDKKGESVELNNIGIIYVELSQYAEALKHFEAAAEIKKELNDERSLSATFENMGIVYQRQLNYSKAIESYYRSLELSEKLNDKNRMSLTHQNIGSLHYAQGEYQTALKSFEIALMLLDNTCNYQQRIQSLNNIATALLKIENFNKAISYFEECLQLSEEHSYIAGKRVARNNLGEAYLELHDYEKARDNFTECLRLSIESNHQVDLQTIRMNLGRTELLLGNLSLAEEHLLASLQGFEATDHKQGVYKLYLYLSELYEKKNCIGAAFNYFKQYEKLKTQQRNTENTVIINKLKTKYEVEKKEKEAEIHKLKNIELKDVLEDLTIEKRKSEKLLLNILPEEIAFELKHNGKVKAQHFSSVSVMFADIKSFTKHSERLSPDEVVELLDTYFVIFDDIAQRHNIEKIKTIGDAYLCVSGLPNTIAQHATLMVEAAIEMRNTVQVENTKRTNAGLPFFEFRWGIHSGPVIAGIVGKTKFEYDIWGDAVNTAARMEQNGEPGKINVSGDTFDLIKQNFTCSYRGKLAAKNKGDMDMYFVG